MVRETGRRVTVAHAAIQPQGTDCAVNASPLRKRGVRPAIDWHPAHRRVLRRPIEPDRERRPEGAAGARAHTGTGVRSEAARASPVPRRMWREPSVGRAAPTDREEEPTPQPNGAPFAHRRLHRVASVMRHRCAILGGRLPSMRPRQLNRSAGRHARRTRRRGSALAGSATLRTRPLRRSVCRTKALWARWPRGWSRRRPADKPQSADRHRNLSRTNCTRPLVCAVEPGWNNR